jgi:protein-disulfide isomerase
LKLTRRAFPVLVSMTGLATLTGVSPWRLIGSAAAQQSQLAAVAKPSPLGDMALGPETASVTVVEYASMTCPHCAAFTVSVFPKLKAEYIDTGKIRFIFREFPLDVVAAAGSMLARCIAKNDAEKYFAVVDILFKQQAEWAVKNPLEPLKRLSKQAGLSEDAFNACLKDQAVLDGIKATQEYAANMLKVDSTPSFFVNGTLVRGETSLEAFEKLINPLLKS